MCDSFIVGSDVVAFSATVGIIGVSVLQFNTDPAAQIAACNATAASMPGVYASQVSIGNVTDATTSRRMLTSRQLTSGINVKFNIATTLAQLTASCSSCTTNATASYAYLTSSLSTALLSGAYTETLQTVSTALGATATESATSSSTATYTTPVTYTTTPAPSKAPGSSPSKGITDGGIAGAVIGSVFGFAMILALIYFAYEKGMIGGATAEADKDQVLQMHNIV